MPIFCDQSRICGKYIKDVDFGDRKKNKEGIFCGQAHIYGKYIKKCALGIGRESKKFLFS